VAVIGKVVATNLKLGKIDPKSGVFLEGEHHF
jgi:hypothetical protein